jgi:hypothetical protein
MCSLEKRILQFRGQKFANSLYFSLLAGNLGGEELAPDCTLRHPVWVAEKSGCIPLKIAAKKRRNSVILAPKPGTGGPQDVGTVGSYAIFVNGTPIQ